MTVLIQGQLWLLSLANNIANLCDTAWCELFTQWYILLSTCEISLGGAWLMINFHDINTNVIYSAHLPN